MKRLVAWLSMGEENQSKYQRWLNSPITKLVMESMRLDARPQPTPIEALVRKPMSVSTMLHCELIGKHRVLDEIELALQMVSQPEPEEERADYGAQDVLNEDYGEGFFPREDD